MTLLGVNNHANRPSQPQRFFFFYVMLLAIMVAGCSKDEGEDDNDGHISAKTHYLGKENPNMPSDGNIMTEYEDAPLGYDISKLVDNNASTSYLTRNKSVVLTWVGSKGVNPLAYSLTASADDKANDPRSWTLAGLTAAGNWVNLDARINEKFENRKETKRFELNTTASYVSFKLSITGNCGGPALQLAEWKIEEVPPVIIDENSIDDLIERSFNSTKNNITPMGNDHLNDRNDVTPEELEWLANPAMQPATFDNFEWHTFDIDLGTRLFPYGAPRPADVNQHWIGDCCLLAVLAHMAHFCPAYISSIIEDHRDNTFTVTLYDPQGNPVKVGVDNLFIGRKNDLGAVSGKGGRVTWATVIEKAIIKWQQVFRGSPGIGGIDTVYASAIITGCGFSFTFNPESNLTADEWRRVVNVSVQEKKILVGGFRYGDLEFSDKYHTVNLHAYSIFPVDKKSKYIFAMRNPWGTAATINNYDASKEDGVMNIPSSGNIYPTIDVRVVEAGAAASFYNTGAGTYSPPMYSPAPMSRAGGYPATSHSLTKLEILYN